MKLNYAHFVTIMQFVYHFTPSSNASSNSYYFKLFIRYYDKTDTRLDNLRNIIYQQYNLYAFLSDDEAAFGAYREPFHEWIQSYNLKISFPIQNTCFDKHMNDIKLFLDIENYKWNWFKISPIYIEFKRVLHWQTHNVILQSSLMERFIINLILYKDVIFTNFITRNNYDYMSNNSINECKSYAIRCGYISTPTLFGKPVYIISNPSIDDTILGIQV